MSNSALAYTISFNSQLGGLNKARTEFGRFKDLLSAALTINIGDKLIAGVQSAAGALKSAIADGVRFNVALDNAQTGIAGIFKQFNPDKFSTFSDALSEAGDAVALLREKSVKAPGSFQDLASAYMGLAGPMSSAGIAMRDQVDLVVLMSQSLAGLGIRNEQLLQESRALVTGRIDENAAAAKILGITKQQIDAAREQGDLYGFLKSRLAAFAEAGDYASKRFTVSLSALKDRFQQVMGTATQGLVSTLTAKFADLESHIAGPKFQAAMSNIGKTVGNIAGKLMDMTAALAENADTVGMLAKALAGLVVLKSGLSAVSVILGGMASAKILSGAGAVSSAVASAAGAASTPAILGAGATAKLAFMTNTAVATGAGNGLVAAIGSAAWPLLLAAAVGKTVSRGFMKSVEADMADAYAKTNEEAVAWRKGVSSSSPESAPAQTPEQIAAARRKANKAGMGEIDADIGRYLADFNSAQNIEMMRTNRPGMAGNQLKAVREAIDRISDLRAAQSEGDLTPDEVIGQMNKLIALRDQEAQLAAIVADQDARGKDRGAFLEQYQLELNLMTAKAAKNSEAVAAAERELAVRAKTEEFLDRLAVTPELRDKNRSKARSMAEQYVDADRAANGGDPARAGGGTVRREEGDRWAKMGLFLSGTANTIDYARRSADGIGKLVTLTGILVSRVAKNRQQDPVYVLG